MVYIYSIILLSHTTNEILPFATAWVDLEGNMLSAISQKRNILYYITYMWNVKKYSKLVIIIKKKQAHTENKLVVTRGKGQYKGGRVGGTSFWVNKLFKI